MALALAGCRCSGSGLQQARSAVSVIPATLDFGNVYVQATPTRGVTALNSGDAPDTLTWSWIGDGGGPFSSDAGALSLAPGASLQIPFTFAPTQPGPASAAITFAWSEGSAGVTLTGNALAWPPCNAQGPCASAAFDPQTGICSQQPVADGTACDAGEVCLVNTVCVSGECLGELNSCDAGDACSLSYCVPGEGCHTQDESAKCQGSDPCRIYSCDPKTGCQSSAAPDGTPCSSKESCQTATICVAGACIGTAVPSGTPCALWWAPCVTDATCKGGSCDSPTADAWTPGQELWSWVDAGYMVGRGYGDTPLAVDGAGTTYLPYQAKDGTETLRWMALDACGRARWDVPLGQVSDVNFAETAPSLVDGQLIAWNGSQVAGLLPATGAVLWQTDLAALAAQATGLPDGSLLETTSMVATNQGQLVFGANYDYQSYDLLLALDDTGAPVWTQQIPFDSTGLLADFAGDVYFAGTDEAPAGYPDGGSWLASVDPTGNLRFALASVAGSPQAVGPNDIVTLQGFTGGYYYSAGLTSFGFDGVQLGATVDLPMDILGDALGSVVDANGVIYTVGAGNPNVGAWFGTIAAVTSAGSLAWSATLPGGQLPISLPALGDGDTLFVVTMAQGQYPDDYLLGFDTTQGTLLWQADLGLDPNYGLSEFQSASLALSATGQLLVSNLNGVTAYFAGQHQPPAGAPWPRQGGDDTNRYCPPPPPGG